MMIKKYCIIIFVLAYHIVSAQNFFQFHVNDEWTYGVNYYGKNSNPSTYKIVKDTTFENGKRYFVFNESYFELGRYARVDSQYVYSYYVSDKKDVPIFKLNVNTGDVERLYNQKKVTIGKIDTTIVLGERVKTISYLLELCTMEGGTFAEKFGLINYVYYNDPPGLWPSTTYTLTFCRINNINYGTRVNVEQFQNIPNEYMLLQNYPNPFNPKTTINYSIPKTSFVIIKVYDVLGKEVATLVNENKSAGNYSVVFNASKLASGVYYYIIRADNYTDIKKLILLK